jgi:ADP-ribose pyrophosphatase
MDKEAGATRKVEEIRREPAFRGYYAVDRVHLKFERFDGSMSALISREVFRSGDSVALLPYDPARDAVLLIEQFRPGPYLGGGDGWLIEIVAGRMEDGETPEAVGRRETVEEAGLAPLEVVSAGGYFVSPGDSSQFVHMLCGHVDLAHDGGTVHGLADENEDIRTLVLPLDEALAWLDDGRVTSSPAVVGLNWLARKRDELRRLWLAR